MISQSSEELRARAESFAVALGRHAGADVIEGQLADRRRIHAGAAARKLADRDRLRRRGRGRTALPFEPILRWWRASKMAGCCSISERFLRAKKTTWRAHSAPPAPKDCDNSIASSAVRSAMRSIKMLSFAACAPSPTPPSPSSVGIPSAAVKFPSDPPPVADSSQLHAQLFRAARGPFEIAGGWRAFAPWAADSSRPPLGSSNACRTGARPRNFLSSDGASFAWATRMSTSTRASAATTLVRVPPEITPGFTVTPFFEIRERGDRSGSGAPTLQWRSLRLEIDACMRRSSFHRNRVSPTPLRAVLSFPSIPCPAQPPARRRFAAPPLR